MKKKISVVRRAPPTCPVCGSTNTEFRIYYTDRDNPGHPMRGYNGYSGFMPTDSAIACPEHVVEVTAILYRRNGLDNKKGAPPSPSLGDAPESPTSDPA